MTSTHRVPRRPATGTPDRLSAEPSRDREGTSLAAEIRTVFVSDVHLGCHHARAEELLAFLQEHTPERLYLVGDFFDARALSLGWHWPPVYTRLMNRLAELIERGTRIRYTPGNHDDYLRHREVAVAGVEVADEFVHRTGDGKRFGVLHGDQFDEVESKARWLSWLGSVAYTGLLGFDRSVNRCLRALALPPQPISRTLKQSTKRIVQWFSGFEDRVAEHARRRGCDAVICGHVHIPVRKQLGELTYFNLGDWVENSTALVEDANGQFALLDFGGDPYRAPSPQTETERLSLRAAELTRQLLAGIGGSETAEDLVPALSWTISEASA